MDPQPEGLAPPIPSVPGGIMAPETTSWATWSDFPVEILEQIIVLCDIPTLLALGRLNHQLNRLALEQLFKRENVTSPTEGYIVSRLAPSQVIPALNLSLWITRLPHITYYLNPDIHTLCNEVTGITRLVDRVAMNERLDLYFSSVDRWLEITVREGKVSTIKAVVWRNMFVGLLETALRKGCKFMRVDGAHNFEMYFVDYPQMKQKVIGDAPVPSPQPLPPPPPPQQSVGQKLTRWVRKCLGLGTSAPVMSFATPVHTERPVWEFPPALEDETVSTSFTACSPSLTSLNLRSSMMLRPLFFPHTLNLIRDHASVLQHLELVSIRIATSIWTRFFKSISLPVLETFIYLYDTLIVEEAVLTPELLLGFFVRHPTIRELELYGVSTSATFPGIKSTLLPNLESLDAHPRIVSWLLQHPTACPKLGFVSITSEYLASWWSVGNIAFNQYDTFDIGIVTIASRLASNPSSATKSLHLQFKFSTEQYLDRWFLAHVTAPSTSCLRLLQGIEKLSLSAHYHTRLEWGHRDVIPDWLALFPSLRWLEFCELAEPEGMKSDEFVSAVKGKCPLLENMVVGRVWVLGKEED